MEFSIFHGIFHGKRWKSFFGGGQGESFGGKIWRIGGEFVTLLSFCDARRIGARGAELR
jgi:hypothetical protein